jgi:hypothetical protein
MIPEIRPRISLTDFRDHGGAQEKRPESGIRAPLAVDHGRFSSAFP